MSVKQLFAEHASVIQAAATTLASSLEDAAKAMQYCLAHGHKILACGNGGSAATAQHLVAELVCRFRVDRYALAALALSVDVTTLTSIGNDYGYDRVFARQVESLAVPGDVLVAISTSGSSPNVVAAAEMMRVLGGKVIALTGEDGGALATHGDIVVRVPSRATDRIQEVHDICIHVLAEELEEKALQSGEL